MSELKRISSLYEKNFKMMMKTVGTAPHKIYTDREVRLDRMDINIRKKLGIYIYDPCPLNSAGVGCDACVGKYGYAYRTTPKGKTKRVTVQDKNGKVCSLKHIGGEE